MYVFLLPLIVVFLIIVGIFSVGVYLLSSLLGGFSNLKGLFYKLAGWGSDDNSWQQTDKKSATGGASPRKRQAQKDGNTEGKVFGQDEGTYVDFEEVKDR